MRSRRRRCASGGWKLGLLALLLSACRPVVSSALEAPLTLAPSGPAATAGPRFFQHIFIIILENKSRAEVLADPYLSELAGRGSQLTNYHGVAHPSQPNYMALLAGEPLVPDDGQYDLPQTNLVDLLEAAHVSWKAYQADYPGDCFTGPEAGEAAAGLYVRKHNPFISFDTIRNRPERCAQIVPGDQLAADLAAHQLPAVSFYVPNQRDNTHDTPLAAGAEWLRGFLEPKLTDPRFAADTLVMVVFEESSGNAAEWQSNLVYSVLLGPLITPGASDATAYTHYSLLRTIEDNFGLGSLQRYDAQAAPFAPCNFTGGCGPALP